MFRTVSEIRARIGRSFMDRRERLGSSSRSIRAIGTPWGSGGGLEEAFSDFLGHHADLLEEHRKSVYLVPFFFNGLRAKVRRYARSDLHKMEHRTGPRLPFSELGMSEAQPPGALPPPGAACAGGAPNRPRPRVRAVRPARGNPWGRSGRLHAPEAPRTGPVNAFRALAVQ